MEISVTGSVVSRSNEKMQAEDQYVCNLCMLYHDVLVAGHCTVLHSICTQLPLQHASEVSG
jgi:hypothetical protein